MNSCEILTAGMDGTCLRWLRQMPPFPGFVHHFHRIRTLAELPEKLFSGVLPERRQGDAAGKPAVSFVVVIIDESATGKIPLPALRETVNETMGLPTGEAARCVLCASDMASLTDAGLSALDDLWAKPLTPATLGFYFRRLQAWLEKDAQERTRHDRLLEMARQDCLTGLATRWYLQEYIEANRDEPITCVYFDLDHFKEVNDTWGHQAGDKALAATAEMMQREFADGFAARLGGDEFMVVLKRQQAGEVRDKVNAFLDKLMDYYHGSPFMGGLSISAGIASDASPNETVDRAANETAGLPANETVGLPTGPACKSIDQLIHESDRALYRAKASGRACCRVYEPSMG